MATQQYSDNIPYLFSKTTEIAQLPPDVADLVGYDLLYDGGTLEQSIENHWGTGMDDPFFYEDLARETEENDPDALEKAMYQRGILETTGQNPIMTPYGPALTDEAAQAVLDGTPGAKAIAGDFIGYDEGWDDYFNTVEDGINTAEGSFADARDNAYDYALASGNLDILDQIYQDTGNEIGSRIDAQIGQPVDVNLPGDIGLGEGDWGLGGAGYRPPGAITDAIGNAVGATGNFLKGLLEDVGQRQLDMQRAIPGVSGAYEKVDADWYHRSLLKQLNTEGVWKFTQSMVNDISTGVDDVSTYEEFLNRAVAAGDISQVQADQIRNDLDRINTDQKFVENANETQQNAATDYDLTMSGTQIEPWKSSYVDPGGDYYDYIYPEETVVPPGDGETPGGPPKTATKTGDQKPTVPTDPEAQIEREKRIREYMGLGASRTGAEYVVDGNLDPNRMRDALIKNYIIYNGMSPEEAETIVDASNMPSQPGEYVDPSQFETEANRRILSSDDRFSYESAEEQPGAGQERDKREYTSLERVIQKYGANSPEALYFQEHGHMMGEDFKDAYGGVIGDDYRTIFTQQWNLIPGAGSFKAQDVFPLAYADVDSLYYLQRDVNQVPGILNDKDVGVKKLSIDTDLWDKLKEYREMDPGAMSDQDVLDLRDLEALKEKELTAFTDYTKRYLEDPGMRHDQSFYKDVQDLASSMYRFTGESYEPTFDRSLEKQYERMQRDPDWEIDKNYLPLLDVNQNPIVPYKGESLVDTLWKRHNFMDPTNSVAMGRLANLTALYNLNPGADRYEQNQTRNMMTTTLKNWLTAGRTTEQFLMTFAGKRPAKEKGAWEGIQ